MKCKHNFVRSGHGNDLICTRCGYAAMQATLSKPLIQPVLRETIEVPFYNGSEHTRVSTYKDDIERALNQQFNIGINYNEKPLA